MKPNTNKVLEWFLRISLSAGFLSATADRFGVWDSSNAVWGSWDPFVLYTKSLLPGLPDIIINAAAIAATALELVFGILLLTNLKTSLIAKSSGILLLTFALAMTFSKSVKAPLDYSVFTAAAAAFALSAFTARHPK